MALLARLRLGIVLTKDSLSLIRHHPRLILFPIIGGLSGLAFLGVFLGILFGIVGIQPSGPTLIALFFLYLLLTMVSSLFTAGLVHQTRAVLAGEDVSVRAGIHAAWKRKGPLLIWSLIAATVGVLISGLENSDSRASALIGSLFSIAWTLMTFFIIPVIVFERSSTIEMFTRSAEQFKATYGETPVSLLGVQLVGFIVGAPLFLLGYVFFASGVMVLAVVAVIVGVGLSFIASQTLQGVVKTVLYFYADSGTKPEEFDDIDFESFVDDTTPESSGQFSRSTI